MRGSTDDDGAKVTTAPTAVPDLLATMATLLGLDPAHTENLPSGPADLDYRRRRRDSRSDGPGLSGDGRHHPRGRFRRRQQCPCGVPAGRAGTREEFVTAGAREKFVVGPGVETDTRGETEGVRSNDSRPRTAHQGLTRLGHVCHGMRFESGRRAGPDSAPRSRVVQNQAARASRSRRPLR